MPIPRHRHFGLAVGAEQSGKWSWVAHKVWEEVGVGGDTRWTGWVRPGRGNCVRVWRRTGCGGHARWKEEEDTVGHRTV